MRMLGKIAMVPTIASGLIAAGAGAATAQTAAFPTQLIFSQRIDYSPGGLTTPYTAHKGDAVSCFSSAQAGGVWYDCTDLTQSVTGWIPGTAFGQN
jgi:hypothetical protein